MNAPDLQFAIDRAASGKVSPALAWIGGRACEAVAGERLPCVSPIDGQAITTIAACDVADVDMAVAAARDAFTKRVWAGVGRRDRKRTLLAFADLIAKHRVELGVLQARDMGMPVGMAIQVDVGEAAHTVRWYAEAVDKMSGEMLPLSDQETGYVARVPLGVVGVIVPWNFPLMIAAWKIGPALAAGNSVVIKPAEEASLAICRLGELAAEAGLPDGVLNIVPGRGETAGRRLALHCDVDAIAFTGSGAVGAKLLEYAGQSNLKRVSLECGGKTANIVMADAPDLESAAQTAARAIFRNQGQICNAPSRLLLQRPIHDAVLQRVVEIAATLRVGNPLDLKNDMGPLVNADRRKGITAALDRAERAGARFALDGRTAPVPDRKHYLAPSVVAELDPDSELAQDEVFGPVLAVMPFDELDDAIRIANGTRYALGAAIWTRDLETAMEASDRLVAGSVYVNACGGISIEMPFGGFKESGYGRDRSLHAFDKYTDLKAVLVRRPARH